MVEQCTVKKPLMIYIPPGKTIKITCPIHPDGHELKGMDITW